MCFQAVLEIVESVHGPDRLWQTVPNFRTGNSISLTFELFSGPWNQDQWLNKDLTCWWNCDWKSCKLDVQSSK